MSQEAAATANTLEQALSVIRTAKGRMIHCLDSFQLMDGLKHASTILTELRSGSLGPKQYYELYMVAFDSLGYLSTYLAEAHKIGRHHLADLYELVQYAGNIVPRLYLMVTVGSVYMNVPGAPLKEILRDMMEMSRGVQHPIRGLFLRYYLSGQTKDHLPAKTHDSGLNGDLRDSLQFTLTNFIEMNKLWVRLQHQGHSRDRQQRELERAELKTLVGTNLVRLSQLDGVTQELYAESILPAVLEQVTQCRDVLAQEYLLEVVLQVFPDEYHFKTLAQLLAVITKLNMHVNIRNIYNQVVLRLKDFLSNGVPIQKKPKNTTLNGFSSVVSSDSNAATDPENFVDESPHGRTQLSSDLSEDALDDIFEMLWSQMLLIFQVRNELKMHDISSILLHLTQFARECYPGKLEYIARIMQIARDKTVEHTNSTELHSPATVSSLTRLMLVPVEQSTDILDVLNIDTYRPLLKVQSNAVRRAVALSFLTALLENHVSVATTMHTDGIFELIDIYLTDTPVSVAGRAVQRDGTSVESSVDVRHLLARLVHQIRTDNRDIQYSMLCAFSKALSPNAALSDCTTPSLVYNVLELVRGAKSAEHEDTFWSRQRTEIFRFLQEQVVRLLDSGETSVQLALKLSIHIGLVADHCACESFAYEYFAQAFSIYENSISDSRIQYQMICFITRSLHQTRSFTTENYDTLITKCALHSARLLKKPDQARAVLAASHLWWMNEDSNHSEEHGTGFYRDEKRVLECLQKALKIADACMDTATSIQLFIEILNQYIYYFELQNTAVRHRVFDADEKIAPKYITGLIDLIKQNMDNLDTSSTHRALGPSSSALFEIDGTLSAFIADHLERTLQHIRTRKDDAEAPQWNALET